MSNDCYKHIRKALEMGPTPGPWEVVGLSGYGGLYALRMPHRSGCTWYGVEGIKRREDAEYFVACDPDTIRALLEERDTLREALEMIVKMVETDGFAWDYAMDVARAALAKENSMTDRYQEIRDASGRLLDRRVSQRWYPSKTQSVSFWCPTCNCYQQRSRIDGKCPVCRAESG